jgi:hypothetical protein
MTIFLSRRWVVMSAVVGHFIEEGVRLAKVYCYCPECKKMLTQVLSSFECLATWDNVEDYYVPGNECKLVNRCPDCGTLAKEKERKIHKELKTKTGGEDVRPSHFKRKQSRV